MLKVFKFNHFHAKVFVLVFIGGVQWDGIWRMCIPIGSVTAQTINMTAGLQFKPILPSDLFNTGRIETIQNDVDFIVDLTPTFSFSTGMVIRIPASEQIHCETGINITRREYHLFITEGDFSISDGFVIIGYEVPLLGLLYIRLGDRFFMNTAFGGSLDFYPSNITSKDSFFQHFTKKKSWIQPALLANLGWEYRTEQTGYYYIGASYHMPFTEIANTKIRYDRLGTDETIEKKLYGTYLTLDIRYFFSPKRKYNKYK